MRKIKPADVLKAYKNVGIMPTQFVFRDPQNGACCGLTAFICDKLHKEPMDLIGIVETAQKLGLSKIYIDGFTSGFDAYPDFPFSLVSFGPKKREAFEAGFTSAKLVYEYVQANS